MPSRWPFHLWEKPEEGSLSRWCCPGRRPVCRAIALPEVSSLEVLR